MQYSPKRGAGMCAATIVPVQASVSCAGVVPHEQVAPEVMGVGGMVEAQRLHSLLDPIPPGLPKELKFPVRL